MTNTVVFGISALVVSYLAVYGIRLWAKQRDMLDIPNERSLHVRPTPVGGGLAIVGVTLTGLIIHQLIYSSWVWPDILAYVIGAGLLAGISWLDDLRSVSIRLRFVIQGLSAILLMIRFGFWTTVSIPAFGQLHLGWIGLPITFLWVVGLTNAYNFMDGIDGLAAGQAVVAGLSWFILSMSLSLATLQPLALLVTASSLGFLLHNISPARIFMGDVGSAFLGYTFAALSVIAFSQTDDQDIPLIGTLIMAPFVFDTSLTIIRRAVRRKNVLQAHKSHLYQRLIYMGYSHGSVTTLYIVLAILASFSAFLYLLSESGKNALVSVLGILGILIAFFLGTLIIEIRHRI